MRAFAQTAGNRPTGIEQGEMIMTLQTSRRLLLGTVLAAPFIRTASAQTTLEWVADPGGKP